ncbi:unnamed protein product [Clonostachys rosea f. rosea IK726]|uniref:Uncharacterized protein n=1 Tax=Clonostachys rosea f. rosea IK726 TaxID=1349383 RepID=A0ACA9TXB9_BIOOC|nr:unnamed protein product [Clonostachys rosea f. rosea IK726]
MLNLKTIERRKKLEKKKKKKKTYLLFHLADLELVGPELRVIHLVFVFLVALPDHALHLADERPAGGADGLAGLLELLLALGHEPGLDAARRHQLRRRGGDVVGRDDELLGAVAVREDAVGRLDERVGGRGDRLGRGDEPLGPAVVLLVKGRARRRPAAGLDNLLLGGGGGLDELRYGIGDGGRGVEDGVVDLELVGRVPVAGLVLQLRQPGCRRGDGIGCLAELRVHEVAEISLVAGEPAESPRRKRLDQLVQLLQVHLDVVVAVDDDVRLLQGVHPLEPEALQSAEELDRRERRLPRAAHQRVGALVVGGQAAQTLGVAADVGDGAREDVDGLDELRGVVDARNSCLEHRVDDVVDLVQVGQDERIDLPVEGAVADSLVLPEIVELEKRLVHARFVDLELLLLVAKQLLQIRVPVSHVGLGVLEGLGLVAQGLLKVGHLAVVLGEHGGEFVALASLQVVGAVVCHAELALELLNLILAAAARSVLVVECAVPLADHVGQLEVLGLDLALQLLAPVDGLLRTGGLELDRLELLQQIEVLLAQLRVEFRQGLVLCAPRVDLLLQGLDLIVAALHLRSHTVLEMRKLPLQCLDALIVLLQHQLITLVLGAGVEVLALELSQATLCLPLRLLREERLLLTLLLFGEASLLLLEIPLRLQLSLLLGQEGLPLSLLEDALLLFVLAVLALHLVLPELGDLIGLFVLRLGRRCRATLNLLLGSGRKGWGILVLGQQVGRFLWQLRDRDEAGEVSQVGTLVVELDESVVLGTVSLSEGLEGIVIAGN